jgi:hypothetical protein
MFNQGFHFFSKTRSFQLYAVVGRALPSFQLSNVLQLADVIYGGQRELDFKSEIFSILAEPTQKQTSN